MQVCSPGESTAYGPKGRIVDGAVVDCCLDSRARMLSFVVNGRDWGVAFTDVPNDAMPAVASWQANEQCQIMAIK